MLKLLVLAFLTVGFSSCVQQQKPLEVDVLKVREVDLVDHGAPMVRGDQNYTFYGKVSAKERQLSLGQYYTITRGDIEEPATVKFRYLQVGSRSEELLKTATFDKGQKRIEFKVAGESYLKNGRVLAWRVELYEKGKLTESKQSYMWK